MRLKFERNSQWRRNSATVAQGGASEAQQCFWHEMRESRPRTCSLMATPTGKRLVRTLGIKWGETVHLGHTGSVYTCQSAVSSMSWDVSWFLWWIIWVLPLAFSLWFSLKKQCVVWVCVSVCGVHPVSGCQKPTGLCNKKTRLIETKHTRPPPVLEFQHDCDQTIL